MLNAEAEKVLTLKKPLRNIAHNIGTRDGLNDRVLYSQMQRVFFLGEKDSAFTYISDMGAVFEKKPFGSKFGHSAELVPFCANKSNANDRCGYMSMKTGKVVIPASFKNASAFTDGVAVVYPAYRVIKQNL